MKALKIIILLFSLCLSGYSQNVPSYSPSELATLMDKSLDPLIANPKFYAEGFIIMAELRSGEFDLTHNSKGDQSLNLHILSRTPEYPSNLWKAAFKAITTCNELIDKAPTLTPTVTEVVDRRLGKAKLIRALAYHTLLQFYADRYFKPDTLAFPAPMNARLVPAPTNIPIQTVRYIYDKVIDDLSQAESYLSSTPGAKEYHKNVAIALKTRVYLSMNRYEKVVEEAEKIIGAYSLESDVQIVFSGSYNGPEAILWIDTAENPLTRLFYNNPKTGRGDFFLNNNGILSNSQWKVSDSRRVMISLAGGRNYLSKYKQQSDKIHVIRYSEVLLNLAEALANLSSGIDSRAVLLLNQVHGRSDNTTSFSPTSKQELLDLINTERKIEFLGEGLPMLDILRKQLPFLRTERASLPLYPGSKEYIWTVPLQERITNKAYYKK